MPQLLQIVRDLQQTVVAAVPRVLTGIVVLVVLVVVAKLIERVLRVLLERLRFDSVLEQVGIDKVLHRLGIRQSLNVVLPRLAYFLLLVTEVVMTMMFLFIIFGATDERAPQGFAPIAIGLGLTLIHLISIPVTNTSVNPARSTGVAVFAGGWAVAQLWLFWIAPIVGGVCGAVVYRSIGSTEH